LSINLKSQYNAVDIYAG